ncbi:MAG TPA: hypothetical protein VF381_04115 [Thermoanaerobaculia bacterium]
MKITIGVLAVLCSLIAVSSSAQNARSFVATTGNDANNCTRGSECRTFTRALAVTNTGGEVVAVDSGGFSPFYLSKAVTVIGAPGVVAAVNGTVSVNATSTDRFVIRNLTINTTYPSADSIHATNFSDLFIENCKLYGSIFIGGVGNSATVSDTTVIGSGSSNANIDIVGVPAKVVRCRMELGQYGVYVLNTSATLIDVVVSDNSQAGYIFESTTADTNVTMDHCSSTRDGIGIRSGGYANGATHVNIRLNDCNLNQSQQYGITIGNDTTVYSMGNNMISPAAGAFGDVSGTITAATKY